MARSKRIRRTLALHVSEPRTGDLLDTNSPGQRFASGWARFNLHRMLADGGVAAVCGSDPIVVAGFLAARAAWDAHHHALNWIEVAPLPPAEEWR